MTENSFGKIDSTNVAEQVFRPDINLATNDDMDLLCAVIETMRPDWDMISEDLSHINDRKRQSLHGRVAEQHVTRLLEYLAQSDLFKDVLQMQDLAGKTTKDYRFINLDDHLYVKKRRENGLLVAEYDNILLVNGLPTLVEVKAKGHASDGSRPLSNLFNPDYRNRLFRPLQDYYQTNTFGFIIVTVPEIISDRSTNQARLIGYGGKIIAMNASLEELKQRASEIKIVPRPK